MIHERELQMKVQKGEMASSTASRNKSIEGSAKAMVEDQISQAIQSTSNLLHHTHQSCLSQAQSMKFPRSFLAKTTTIKNTTGAAVSGNFIGACMENALQSFLHLETITRLLSNIESCQLKSLSRAQQTKEETQPAETTTGGEQYSQIL